MSLVKSKRNNGGFPVISMLDDFFNNDLMSRWSRFPELQSEVTMPAVNVVENDEEFTLEMAAPGKEKSDFNIEVNDGVLTISSETSNEDEEVTDNYTRKEYSFNSFSRSFQMPEGTKEDDIKASYNNGVLKVSVPKDEVVIKEKAKTIVVA